MSADESTTYSREELRKGLWICLAIFYTSMTWMLLSMGCFRLLTPPHLDFPFEWFLYVSPLAFANALGYTLVLAWLIRRAKGFVPKPVLPERRVSPTKARLILSVCIALMATGQIAMLALTITNSLPSPEFFSTWLVSPILLITPVVYVVIGSRTRWIQPRN